MNHLLLEASASASLLGTFAPLLVLIVLMYFILIRPQRKRDKEVQAMRSALEVGDEIITVGGIIGRVVNIREDSLVIETGSDRTKLRIARWAIQSNTTPHEPEPEAQ